MKEGITTAFLTMIVIALAISLIFGTFWAIGSFRVWWSGQSGKSAQNRAEYERQVQVIDARARAESAVSLAEAEVNRAKGVAAANKIIAESITEPYLRYLWVQTMVDHEKQIIYVPTEANLPILEAGRLLK